MSNLIHYTTCPICGSADIHDVLSVKDHAVSGEVFRIAECNSCSLRFTQDVPGPDDIGPYYRSEDYVSHSDTSKGLINRLYKLVRKKTMRQKRKLVIKTTGILKGDLLDVGSGTGSFVNEMKAQGWKTTGLEPDAGARVIAKERYHIDLADTGSLSAFSPDSFDAITLWHVLEHVHELSGYMNRLKTLIREKGRIFIAVPNYTSHDATIYKENWAGYDVPRHLYHFSPRSMQVLVEKNGLRILEYRPMRYDSYYISMLSSRYKNRRTNLLGSILNGFRSNIKAKGDARKCSSVIYVVGK